MITEYNPQIDLTDFVFDSHHDVRIYHEVNKGQAPETLAKIKFQKGPVKENGVNGCRMEDLINILIIRLEEFQKGAFNCESNAAAISNLEEALYALESRTKDRQNRGVEGYQLK